MTITAGFAWLKHLDSEEQAEFIAGVLQCLLAAMKNYEWSPVTEWVEEWKATANVYADPLVARSLKQGRDELARGEPVDWDALRQELGF